MATEILFPVGRMVGGNLYKPNPVLLDDGKTPKMQKDGITPAVSYSLGLAIPKGHETHWNQTVWGAIIWKEGETAYPGQCLAPTFAWKITDGDSVIPNKRNKRPCDQTGYPGHWVLWFNRGWAPKLVDSTGTVELLEPESIVPG